MKTIVALVFGALLLVAFAGCNNVTQSDANAVDYVPVFDRSSPSTLAVGSQEIVAPEMSEGEFLRSILTPTVTGFRRASGQRVGTTVHGTYLGRQVSAAISRSGPDVIYDGTISGSGGTFRVSLGPNRIDYQQRVIIDAQNVTADDGGTGDGDGDENGEDDGSDPPDQIYLIDISMSGAEMNRHGWIRGIVYVSIASGPYPAEGDEGESVVQLMRYVFNLIASEELFAVDLINKHLYNFDNEDENDHLAPSVLEVFGANPPDRITYANAQPVVDHIATLVMADPEDHRAYQDWEAIIFKDDEYSHYFADTDGGADSVEAVWSSFNAEW